MASPITPAIADTANLQGATKSAILSIRNVAKTFGRNVVLRNVSLEIAEGEFLTILGESGSGKTTTGRMILRAYDPTAGEIWFTRCNSPACKPVPLFPT